MKTKAILLVILMGTFISCSNDDDNNNDNYEKVIPEAQIPTELKSYVTTHFPSSTINKAVEDMFYNILTYDVYLSGNVALEFDSNYNIIDIDSNSELPDSVIPQAILTYVAANYASNFITDWELELNHQQVELNNDTELEFEMDGTFIRIDND
jgi:hypothetical protein